MLNRTNDELHSIIQFQLSEIFFHSFIIHSSFCLFELLFHHNQNQTENRVLSIEQKEVRWEF